MASAAASGSGSAGSVTAAELQHLRTRVPMMTVVEMKGFIRDLSSQCGTRIQVSGTKPMLINRIEEQLTSWQHASNWTAIRKAMSLVNHPRDRGGNLLDTDGSGANGSGSGTWPPVNTQNGYYASPSYSTQARNGVPPGKLNPANAYRGNAAASGSGSSAVRQAAVPRNVRFKPSPFFKVESMLTDTILLIEADSTRRTASLDLRLTAQQAQLLRTDSANYQARLFCAQKASAEISEKNPGMPAFIDFPGSCELRINSSVYTSSLKGSKSKPGRVPPPNLNKDRTLITRDGVTNKIELVYTNAPYKYVMSIGFCKYTPPETIVAKLNSEKSKSREEIIGTMKRAAAEDDIEIGTATLSLKDPLSYTRINYPCRSIHCSHSQCFDALFFFLSNEQSPTWSCPHCSKILKPEDLFIDGYFAHILKTVSEDEDAVIVEADGSWKTRDGKFSSSAAAIPAASSASLPAATNGNGASQATASSSKPPKRESSVAPLAESVVPPGAEVVELDDTPSPPRSPAAAAPQRPPSPAQPSSAHVGPSASTPRPSNGSTTIGGSSTTDAIDLTESDDEDMPLAQGVPLTSASGPSTRPPTGHSAAASGSSSHSAGANGAGSSLQRPTATSSSMSAMPSSSSSARPYQSQTGSAPSHRPLGPSGSNSSGASPLLPHVRPSGFASFSNPPTPGSVPARASPSGWAGSQPRIVSSTGGMREVRPLAPLWRPGVSTSFSSPGLGPASAPARAPSREQTAPEVTDELPIYPPLLPSRSASTTAASPASSSRDNAFWPTSYKPQTQQQDGGGSSLSSPLLAPSSSSSRVREREESSDAVGGRDSSSKRLRSGGNDGAADTGVTSFTTRSGRPSAAAGSLREASTPLPSVSPTPSPPPTAGSGHTSTRARNSRTHSAEEEDELSGPAHGGASRDDPDYEEEDAPPTRPGRSSWGGGGAAVNSSAVVASDSPAYTSAPEDPSISSSTSRSGIARGGGGGGGGGSGTSTTTAANDGRSTRRADSFDDYDGLMDDHDDSGEWEV